MDRPLIIRNVHNISLESYNDYKPQLVAELSCETNILECFHAQFISGNILICCAIIWSHDVSNFKISQLTFKLQTEHMNGFFLHKTVNVTIEQVEIYSQVFWFQNGITLVDSQFIEIHSVIADNWETGIGLLNVSNIRINNTFTSGNHWSGIGSQNSSNMHISNSCVTKSKIIGVHLDTGSNIVISNVTSMHNFLGMHLVSITGAQIISSNASYNEGIGMVLWKLSNATIINTTTSHNGQNGVEISSSNNTYIYGSIAMYNTRNGIVLLYMNRTYVTRFTTVSNYVNTTSLTNGQILIDSSQDTVIYDTFITVNTSVASSGELTSQPAVIVMYDSTLILNKCTFTGNRISAIRAHASNITLSGELTFSNNTAFTGAVFILAEDSILILAENCEAHFINNFAINTGGVFLISNNLHSTYDCAHFIAFNINCRLPKSVCFINAQSYDYKVQKLFFSNNSAGKGGDLVYGGHIVYGVDENKNCMDSFMDISHITSGGRFSLISSDPLRVCLCNESGLPDCMLLVDPTPHFIYPGQTISISAVVVGQDWGTVAGSVYAQFLHKSTPENIINLESSQMVQIVSQYSCNTLNYSIFTMNEGSQNSLVLTAQYMYVSDIQNDYNLSYTVLKNVYHASKTVVQTIYYKNNPVYVHISVLPCPIGFCIQRDKPFRCDCNKLLEQIPEVQCFIQEQTIGRSGLVWVGMIDDDNGTNGTVAVSQYCPLNYCRRAASNVTLSEPDSQCNYNHSGTLCGGCQPGLSLALGSAQCLPCSNDYLALLIPLTLTGPALVGFIRFVDLTISQGTLNGLVFYANILQVNQDIFFPWRSSHPLTVFIAWLNLDLGVETCLFKGLDAYSKTWLQFVFPFYVWSIAGLIIIRTKQSKMLTKVMGNNSVPLLATLFLLSYAKIFRTVIIAISYTMLCSSHNCKAVWSGDGNLDYLGPKHAPLFVISVIVLVFLWLPYTLLLFLGRWLHKCNSRLIIRMLIKLKPFLDAHYGALKDRHHYWFGALHLMRTTVLLISALIPSDHSSIVSLSIFTSAVALMLFASVVYRNATVSVFNMTFYMNLVLFAGANLYTTISGGDQTFAAYTLIGMAFLQFIGLFIFKMARILQKSPKLMRCVRMRRPVDDDWELYEQAALQREMESDTEEQDSESSGSTESLPTY